MSSTENVAGDQPLQGIITIEHAEALEHLQLRLRFSDHASGTVDLGDLIQGPMYAQIREDPAYFAGVTVDDELGTVVWPNGADLSPNVLRELLVQEPGLGPTAEPMVTSSQTVIDLYDKLRGSQLHYGDNLHVLRERIPDESVDLVYLDPPFNSKKVYNAFYQTETGVVPEESIQAFEDFWIWDHRTMTQYEETVSANDRLAIAMKALRSILGDSDLMAYLVMMAPRLVELRRVLKPTGSIYLHCDQTASHYLKVLLDTIFGGENFLNDIVWLYGLGGNSKRYWPRKHDDILWYSKKVNQQFFEATMIPATSQKMKGQLKKEPDYWAIPSINNMAKERMGFPTQKPLELLMKIVQSSSPSNGVVLDPFCGCGTTVEAAEHHGRQWVGIDVSYIAIEIIQKRLLKVFGSEVAERYRVFGRPASMEEARQLYEQRTLDFGYWAVSLVNADPVLDSDRAYDGVIRFPMPDGEDDGLTAVSVGLNGGSSAKLTETVELVESGRAALGLLIPLNPDAKLRRRAAAAGSWRWPITGVEYPRIQVVSVEELLTGTLPVLPPGIESYSITPARSTA